MASKPNATKLMDQLEDLRDTVNEIANEAEAFGGEIARQIAGVARNQLAPQVAQLLDFLNAAPLAWTRPGQAAPGGTTPAGEEGGLTPMPSANPSAPSDGMGLAESRRIKKDREAQQAWADEVYEELAALTEDSDIEEVIERLEAEGIQFIAFESEDEAMNWEEEMSAKGFLVIEDPSLYGSDSFGYVAIPGPSRQAEAAPSIRSALQSYEEEVDFGDALDFRKVAESYKAPKKGVSATREQSYGEDKIFSQYLENSARPAVGGRLDEDILAGSVKHASQEEVHSMDDWRTMVESSPIEGVRAEDLADILMGEKAQRPSPAGRVGRMDEAVSFAPEAPMDGDVMADILHFDGPLV
jgi:hypothetical protein